MKKMSLLLLKKYGEMPGDKKVRIALDLSNMVRKIRKEGEIAMQKHHGNKSN